MCKIKLVFTIQESCTILSIHEHSSADSIHLLLQARLVVCSTLRSSPYLPNKTESCKSLYLTHADDFYVFTEDSTMKVQHLNSFLFDSATYTISDQHGHDVQLKVNYKDRQYKIENAGEFDKTALAEITSIASDLLQRKSGVNIAEQ